ncbi:OmpA family protein [Pseudomonadales bacterium]|nr:OmpA family protein [Pseudomonadales bacterium]
MGEYHFFNFAHETFPARTLSTLHRHTSYNSELSRRRAEAVADYLASKGISRNQLTVRFHGERFPVSPNTSVAGKADNRRVTLRVERVPQPIARR